MKNSAIVILIIWILLALINFVGCFVHLPAFFSITFGGFNLAIIAGLIPLLINEIKIKRALKKSK